MVTVDRRPGVLPRDLTATSFANPHIDGAHCGIVYLECSRCRRYVGGPGRGRVLRQRRVYLPGVPIPLDPPA